MKKTFHKGFTLIELLVVVAIIAILSATILASLASARNKAKDAKIQSELSSTQAQMELYADSNGSSYNTGATATTSCGSGAFAAASTTGTDGAADLITGIAQDTTGSTSDFSDMVCGADANTWAAEAKLSTGSWWCVDSNGVSRSETTQVGQGSLGSSPFACP